MLNVVVLTGRLSETPELRHTPNGVPVTRFAVAVQRAFKSTDGDYETDFINIVAWRSQAEFITRFFTKGQEIGIQGSIQTRRYTDKDGNKRTAFEVIVERVHFVGSKRDTETVESSAHYANSADDFAEVDDGDLPF